MPALDAWLPHLRCTVCGSEVERAHASVRCGAGHTFDIARQGYLNLGVSQRDARADSPAMVMAREDVQLAGVFDDVAQAVNDAAVHQVGTHLGAPSLTEARVVDLAGGTGFYLTQVLDRLEAARGLVVDLSVPALKRAAKAHPSLAAVGADLTKAIPVATGRAHVVMSVFGPRNAGEMRRILAPGGSCIVVTPRADHLGELIEHVGMVRVAPDKTDRLLKSMQGFEMAASRTVTVQRELEATTLTNLVAMGPSAHHLSSTDIAARVNELVARSHTGTVSVSISVDVATFVAGSELGSG